MSEKHKEQIAIACWMSDLIYDFQTDFSSLSWYLSFWLRDAVHEAAIQSATYLTNPHYHVNL